jgi:hypothetical protein
VKSKLRSALAALATAALAAAAAPAQAQSSYHFQFGNLLTGEYNPPAGTFAWLSIATADNLRFTYDLQIGDLQAFFGPDAFVGTLLVNSTSSMDPLNSAITAGSWGVDRVVLWSEPPTIGGVAWDFGDFLCSSGSSCFGTNRLTSYEHVQWETVFATEQLPPIFAEPPLALKVLGLTPEQSSTGLAYYTPLSPVPEPETYGMLLAGLGALVVRLKRRNRKSGSA